MPSTSVHFPDSLLAELNHLASEAGVSRNRLIVEACRETLRRRRRWPPGFFDDSRFRTMDLQDLRASATSFEQGLAAARRNRDDPPL
ncbi:MAG: hypothetical protein D6696_11530 [Acidobacteria bacterium]|nr:MAG: hypothetical protein D6696_11530 [Acidobacteriota bacterium]